MIDIHSYDKYIVAFSGGKDSTAALLDLLKQGVNKDKIELWHHDIDGREGSELMDWTCTRSYCEAFAFEFDLPIFFSWREGGFEREMLRKNALTGGIYFETPDGSVEYRPSQNRPKYHNTRLKFPQVSADLSVRWCSSYLKIDVLSSAIRNQDRFNNRRTLVITGERGQESSARAKYKEFEPHRSDLRDGKTLRHVDHYRPILTWEEDKVWQIIEEYRVHVHPAYYLGFGRVSCLFCIFGNANQFASAKFIAPERFDKLPQYEKQFDCTIKRKVGVDELADQGTVYSDMDPYYVKLARSDKYSESIILKEWKLPKGAYSKDSCGPT